MRIVILNGPNLNLLGRREPAIYGTRSMEQVLLDIQRAYPELHIAYHQSNHEGDLIDWVQEYGVLAIGDWRLAIGNGQEVDGIVLNAGGYTHTSIALSRLFLEKIVFSVCGFKKWQTEWVTIDKK